MFRRPIRDMLPQRSSILCDLGFHKWKAVSYVAEQLFPPLRLPPVQRRLVIYECERCKKVKR